MIACWMLVPLLLIAGSAAAAAGGGAAVDTRPPLRAPSPIQNAGGVRDVDVQGSLQDALRQAGATARGPLWMAWDVPATASLRDACCFDTNFRGSFCRLESRQQSWGTRGHDTPGSGRLLVLARWSNGKVERVRAVSDGCGLDVGGVPFVRLHGVAPAESVALLAALLDQPSGRRGDGDQPLAALAYHADAAAGEALRRLATQGQPSEQREQALFWIGQARGEEGARFLAGVARTDPSPEIREKAVFSLSQSEAPDAAAAIVDVATHDRVPDVRGEALFWLAQSGAPEAPRVLLARLDADPDREVRKKAIFAISQLEDDEGVPLLMRIVRERRDPEVRREALFWLGQSDDPRALDFLTEVLER